MMHLQFQNNELTAAEINLKLDEAEFHFDNIYKTQYTLYTYFINHQINFFFFTQSLCHNS